MFVIVIILSVSTIGWFGFNNAKSAYVESASLNSKAEVKSLSNLIKGLLGTIPEDIIYNEGFYALEQLFVWEDLKEPYKIKEWESTYESALKDYLQNKKLYYQVRLLDINGFEKLVLKYDEKTSRVKKTAKSKLQDKSSRDYFKNAIRLKNHEFYISIMDLNVEHGVVEKPFIPVVRYSIPIIDENGETKGVLVLNFSASKLLDIIKDIKIKDKDNQYKYYLLNSNGDYLYHNNIDKRWGFQLASSYRFIDDYDIDIGKEMKDKDKITIHKNSKIISIMKIYPNKIGNPNRFWYLASSVDEDVAFSSLDQFIKTFFTILILILIFGIFIINKYIISITNPLVKITSQLNALSIGEIKKEEIEYKSDDEIGQIVKSTNIVIEAIETTIIQANSVSRGDFSKEITLLSKNDKLGLAISDMTKRLKEITSLAKNLSNGNYDTKVMAQSNDDELGLALIEMVAYLENITKVTESIAIGEIDAKYKPKGDDDRLGYAVLEMIKYLKNILKQANAISNEDFSHTITAKSKNDELGNALVTMTDMLGSNSIKTKNEIWLSEGLGNFSDRLTGIDETSLLAKEAITICSRYVDASTGVIYAFNGENKELNLISSFAFISRNNLSNIFKMGEGIVGQVALEQEPILLKNIKDDSFEIQSGTTTAKPKEVFAFPLIHEGELFGVVEIMSFNEFSSLEKEYLLKISNIFATALHTTAQNVQIKTLLGESQSAFEELQQKSEEIQNQSEEIDKRADELESSNQYKSDFLSNMSHELRTPLNSVILLSSLLAKNNKENLNESDIQKANVINESGHELLRLINDILDLSKIESGKMELIVDKINPEDLLKTYDEIFTHTAKDAELEFEIIDNYGDDFYNDKDRLGQIVRNLVSNAFKFTKTGGVTLEISKSENKELPIRISVIDTGMGIPSNKQELIFKAFTQVDGSTSREFGGTGLGLSISKELAHLMHGEIELSSVEGEGATFSILLPSLVDKYNSSAPSPQTLKSINSSDIIINKKDTPNHIQEQFLIIEDDVAFANILKETIEDHGAKAYLADNGKDGLELANKHNIDGAIIDIGLPDMSGIEVIKELKSKSLTKNINIQVISGKDKSEQDFNDIKIDGYLQKPVSRVQINNAIANIENLTSNIKKILIVEDDLLHLKAISDYIAEENDYEIITASSVKEAKELSKEIYFDLAIVDLGLNDGSGSEVCQCLSQNKKDTVILIYTGRDLTNDEADFLNDISDEIIIKNPHSHERLKDEISRFLSSPNQTVNNRFKQQIEDIDHSNYDISVLKNKNVLIVDDDIKNIFVLSSALQEHDMNISHAKNGQEALDFLKNNSDIQIVLMDIMMPVMNGYEAMEAIRKDEKLKHLPIIAVTAKAMEKDKKAALKSGADDYLAKPIDLEKLSGMMSMWINK